MLAEMLGLETYGARSIARVKDNKDTLEKTFSDIFLSHLLISAIVIFVYTIYCLLMTGQDRLISIIQGTYLLGQLFNISWLFTGLSEHKIIVVRSIIIKIIIVILVFTLIRDSDDLLIYIFLSGFDILLSQITLWGILRKYIKLKKPSIKAALRHLKPQVVLFASIIASSIYRMMDKTMIGHMGFLSDLGQYEYADKIVKMPISIITGIGTVMLSNSSHLFAIGEKKQAIELAQKTLLVITYFISFLFFAILSYGSLFCTLYLGKEYNYTGSLLMILAITLLFISWNNVLRTQYFIPQSKDKLYVVAVWVGALINVIINILLIPKYSCTGAAIATVIAYFSVTCFELYFARKELNSSKIIKSSIIPFLLGVFPFACSFLWKELFSSDIIGFFIQAIIFTAEYIIVLMIYLAITNKLNHFKELISHKKIFR